MSIVQTDVPMTSRLCQETIRKLTQTYPFCRSQTLTTTVWGRPVTALTIGSGSRRVLFSAAHHANEWITATLLLKFAEDLSQAIRSGGEIYGIPGSLFQKYVTIHMVPMVDPDGVDLVTGAIPPETTAYQAAASMSAFYPSVPFPQGWKANLQGVDLNLQYPAGWLQARELKFAAGYIRPGPRDYVGLAPLSQRESMALADYTEFLSPALVLAFHTQGQVIYWQFRDIFVPGARELAEEFARLSGYSLEQTPVFSSFAGYKDWFIQYYRHPGFTIEVGKGENPLPIQEFPDIYRDNLGILTTAALGLPSESPTA